MSVEKSPENGQSKSVGSGSSGSAWLGRAATIQRQKCPGRYAGMNAQGFPVWTDSYGDAKEIPAAEVQSELNRVGVHEPMSWAVIFPQNFGSQPCRKPSTETSET